jgi:hypothetical protein
VSETEPAPPLTESARSVNAAARNLASAWGGSFAALRRLLAADLALARQALIHGLVLLFAAAILLGTTWALLTAFAVWALYKAGTGWGIALVLPLLVSAMLGYIAFRRAESALRLADLDASRRQLTLWFGTADEVEEAKNAPPGSLDAGAPAPDTSGTGGGIPTNDDKP